MNVFNVFVLLLAIIACAFALPTGPFDARCEQLKAVEDKDEPMFEIQVFKDCINNANDKCKTDEVCCPKMTGGTRCVKLQRFIDLKIDTPKMFLGI